MLFFFKSKPQLILSKTYYLNNEIFFLEIKFSIETNNYYRNIRPEFLQSLIFNPYFLVFPSKLLKYRSDHLLIYLKKICSICSAAVH